MLGPRAMRDIIRSSRGKSLKRTVRSRELDRGVEGERGWLASGRGSRGYYAEASCTAGRANFITGELPIRTGSTTVGQAGSPIGMPAEAPTIATAPKSMGYTPGQFGQNHPCDLNHVLPPLHGFRVSFR